MADLEHFKRYGWAVSETNLDTLPDDAPQAAKDLAKRLTLEGRRRSLTEWLSHVQDDGRIHGKFWHIGAWTHRMSHSNPNQANIASVWDPKKVPKTPVEEVKAKYDTSMRGCWRASEGAWLVGTDAEGIQLRILAHYMKSPEYVEAITKGNKEDETDIHNLNKRALGTKKSGNGAPLCEDRDTAKTFIYAWLLGAGIAKVASILKSSTADAKEAQSNFLDSLPELKRLKQIEIKRDAMRGYFIGLDGRKVDCNSEHLMLAGYLQNGESVIMKRATILWLKKAKEEGIKFRLLDLVHDEFQTEVFGSKEDAERLGKIQCEAIEQVGRDLKLFCPLAGNYSIGKDWSQTH